MTFRRAEPFRSLFPIHYYINDFEFAAGFDPESKPESQLATGLPFAGLRTGKYGRDPAPEMLSEAPYCPFRADIWQLGHMFLIYLWVCVVSSSFYA
jgi:hypothetical protein